MTPAGCAKGRVSENDAVVRCRISNEQSLVFINRPHEIAMSSRSPRRPVVLGVGEHIS